MRTLIVHGGKPKKIEGEWQGHLTFENSKVVAKTIRRLLSGRQLVICEEKGTHVKGCQGGIDIFPKPLILTRQKLVIDSGHPEGVGCNDYGNVVKLSINTVPGIFLLDTRFHEGDEDPEKMCPFIVFDYDRVTVYDRTGDGEPRTRVFIAL